MNKKKNTNKALPFPDGFTWGAATCIDCGACILECPYNAIFPEDEVPSAYRAKGGELINQFGLTGHYEGTNHRGEPIVLETVRALAPGEVIDLRPSIKMNANFYR